MVTWQNTANIYIALPNVGLFLHNVVIDVGSSIHLFCISEDAEGAEGFRVPMSLGEPHAELDKSGIGW